MKIGSVVRVMSECGRFTIRTSTIVDALGSKGRPAVSVHVYKVGWVAIERCRLVRP